MVQTQSVPWLKDSEGMLAYFPGEPFENNKREFVMISLWQNLESIKKFAGEDWDAPVITDAEVPLVEAIYANHYKRFDGDLV